MKTPAIDFPETGEVGYDLRCGLCGATLSLRAATREDLEAQRRASGWHRGTSKTEPHCGEDACRVYSALGRRGPKTVPGGYCCARARGQVRCDKFGAVYRCSKCGSEVHKRHGA